MIDIKILRNNPEIVAKALHDKVMNVDLDRVIFLDKERVRLGQSLDTLRARRNELSSQMGKGKPEPTMLEEAKSLKEKIQAEERIFAEIEEKSQIFQRMIRRLGLQKTKIRL